MPSPSSKVLFLIGSGSNAGAAIAHKFSAGGYKVALASRTAQPGFSKDGHFWIKLDTSHPHAVSPAFDLVEKELGSPPSVVVYNCSTTKRNEDPLGNSVEAVSAALNVNTVSVYAAAQAAIKANPHTTFIFTGNYLNIKGHPLPQNIDLGMGKSASASMIEALAAAYKGRARFFYADERKEDGTPMWKGITGDAAAEHYWQLAENGGSSWLQTFVDRTGYVPFEER